MIASSPTSPCSSAVARRVLQVTLEHAPHVGDLGLVGEPLDVDHLRVHVRTERAVLVEYVSDTARHTGAEVAPRRTEHDHAAARHVLAAMVTHAFDDGICTAVAHAEAFARHAADVGLATGGAVKRHIADDDVVLGRESRAGRREHHDLAARKTLADVVVRIALERQAHARRDERAEALAG